MKITTTFLFFFVIISGVFGQKYQPMLTEGSTWYEYYTAGPTWNTEYHIVSDSIINSISYKKINIIEYGEVIEHRLLREDTLEKKVYKLHFNGQEEEPLYDFTLAPEDTFYWSSENFMILDSISDTIINPFFCGEHNMVDLLIENPKVFYFHGASYPIIWIEGIGSLTGLLHNYLEWGGGVSQTLLCHYNQFQERDFHYIYCEEPSPCEGLVLDNKEIDFINDIEVFPNPTSSFINVDLKASKIIKDLEIIIFDLNGIEQIKSLNNYQIDINKLSKGIYFIKIIINNQQYIKKIIKQ